MIFIFKRVCHIFFPMFFIPITKSIIYVWKSKTVIAVMSVKSFSLPIIKTKQKNKCMFDSIFHSSRAVAVVLLQSFFFPILFDEWALTRFCLAIRSTQRLQLQGMTSVNCYCFIYKLLSLWSEVNSTKSANK